MITAIAYITLGFVSIFIGVVLLSLVGIIKK
jgi:hypothetical protein